MVLIGDWHKEMGVVWMIDINQTVPMKYGEAYNFSLEKLRALFQEKCLDDVCERLKNGYIEMSSINLYLAEIGFEQDILDLCMYEAMLTGSEKL